ncbi:hypothetical protein DFH09DRAFT_1078415 [Mycena vulgaris]|nr:hypothetical protein DFH09DRAFT_1078415 [Mycena vulgaris]
MFISRILTVPTSVAIGLATPTKRTATDIKQCFQTFGAQASTLDSAYVPGATGVVGKDLRDIDSKSGSFIDALAAKCPIELGPQSVATKLQADKSSLKSLFAACEAKYPPGP